MKTLDAGVEVAHRDDQSPEPRRTCAILVWDLHELEDYLAQAAEPLAKAAGVAHPAQGQAGML
jgi:hypothetical protein